MKKTQPRRRARILIVDDHPTVREGLVWRIRQEPGLEVCGQAADVREALGLIADTQPDVAIVDVSLKSGDGIDLVKRIAEKHPKVRTLVWSMHGESLYADSLDEHLERLAHYHAQAGNLPQALEYAERARSGP